MWRIVSWRELESQLHLASTNTQTPSKLDTHKQQPCPVDMHKQQPCQVRVPGTPSNVAVSGTDCDGKQVAASAFGLDAFGVEHLRTRSHSHKLRGLTVKQAEGVEVGVAAAHSWQGA